MKQRNFKITALTLFILTQMACSDVRLPNIFSDNMVIQQDIPFKIWGTAQPDENISVTLANKTQSTKAGKAGNWSLVFSPMKASFESITLKVNGKNSIVFKNVLVGEVWLCSGQSNMQFFVFHAHNGKKEIARANNPNIRFFKVTRELVTSPQNNCKGRWEACSPETVAKFSAVGYFFGRQLLRELNVPIGLIGANWGGSRIETWMPMECLENIDFMKSRLAKPKKIYTEMEAYKKANNVAKLKIENNKRAAEAESAEIMKKYSSASFDDSLWKTMTLPQAWEKAALPNYDGIIWFRKTINIPKKFAGKDMILKLGRIDDFDTTYFNGQQVGKCGSRAPERMSARRRLRYYRIPGKLVKAGKNVIAVQAIDDLGHGGFLGPKEQMYLITTGNKPVHKIPLDNQWRYLPATIFISYRKNININMPARLYMGMINPIANYSMRGIIWYQGEENAKSFRRAREYRTLMPAMIQAWRDKWNDQNLVFIQTQLANYGSRYNIPRDNSWAELREAQMITAQKDPLGGLAVTIDIGNPKNIHPRNKQDVGKRLSKIARKLAYKQPVLYSGPMYKSMEIKKGKIYLTFDHVYGGLYAKGNRLESFAVAGKDKKFLWAKAAIKDDKVVLDCKEIKNPVAVRYAWDANPKANLYNSADLPASPFRTDDWPPIK